MQKLLCPGVVLMGLLAAPIPLAAERNAEEDHAISEITVNAERVANTRPAGTYTSPVTSLRFDPLTEIQSRGIAEGQSDVTVRGGVFENTGFKLGAVTVMDPQTGHYVAGLPVDPAFLSAPAIYKGIDNAVEGFNSAVATIAYGIRRLDDGGLVSLGTGSDDLNFQSLRFARTTPISSGHDVGASFSFARSEGDGSVPNGDHEFSRYNLQLQRSDTESQSDLLVSYQDKFYGWPGAYTGFATLAEIDDTQTTLLIANHRSNLNDGWWEVGAFYRRLVDDYDFNRSTTESGAPGSFEHETRNIAVGLQGQNQTGRVSWRYGAQVTSDELVRSTDLTNGNFNDRTYATLTVVPSIDVDLKNSGTLTLRAGATVDYSNRDSNAVLPLFGLVLGKPSGDGQTNFAFEYAATSQLPGYTALNSNPTGLFGGNPDLGRERAKQLALSVSRSANAWQGRVAVFSRRDDNLVDWTYSTGAPFARQANAVDIDVVGFEAFLTRQWANVHIAAGYTYLDKDEDYGSALVDASFYALNFARHRATLAVRYRFAENFELRLDNEYRRQQNNPLRVGDDSTYLASLSMLWKSTRVEGLAASLVADNLTDSEYQPFPGTPAAGRQVSLSASYAW
ncbi:MAG: TonB-dependent receptor [Gammaproteobacteria bacterium]|nr:TonB-dependent receptor [Gammaproteobacteria bacterium]NNL51263.1 TonB-dependent receptor [Woeseiaceae bacterium]